MSTIISPSCISSNFSASQSDRELSALLKGEILIKPRAYSSWGGAVTAQMYLPISRLDAWQQVTDYPRWVQYFPALTQSRVLSEIRVEGTVDRCKRLYQAASKAFLFFVAQVEVQLMVIETRPQRIQFRLESGNFTDFSADLRLQEYESGTVLTYAVQATPTIPVPGLFIQQAIQMDLPANMQNMRRVLCRREGLQ